MAIQNFAPTDTDVRSFPDLSVLPHFNPDDDTDQPPPSVRQFREAVAAADVLVISTPEYAHGIPGVLKNALDWLVGDPLFAGKRIGLLYGSATEASHAHASLIEILKTMSAVVAPEAIQSIASVRTRLDQDGHILDKTVETELRNFLAGLK
jgi:chromate reductase, NAD(P)H dehydrogenase (quinone)